MRLLVSHHSVLRTSTRAGSYYHYSLLWFLWLVCKLEQSKPRKQYCAEKFVYACMVSKWHSKNSHGSNTFTTPSQTTVALRYTILYYRDPLATDDSSRKNSTTLERQPSNANQVKINEVNGVTVRGFPIDAGGR